MQPETSQESDESQKKIQKLICSKPIMLFMRGTPVKPGCGLSKVVVHILREEHVKFGTFDILIDEILQDGLKKLCKENTAFPHLYCNGKMLGGPEMIIHMHHSGQLRQTFVENGIHFVRADADSTVNPASASPSMWGSYKLGGFILRGLFFIGLSIGNLGLRFKTFRKEVLQEYRRSSDQRENALKRGIDATDHPLKGIHSGPPARK